MKYILNAQNGDQVKRAVSTAFPVIGAYIVPDGLGTYIPYNGKDLVTIGTVSGGPFQVGETITGGTSGVTAVVRAVNTGSLVVDTVVNATYFVGFKAGETITGGTSSATAAVTLFIKRNRCIGLNDTIVTSSDADYATAGKVMAVQTPVNLLDKVDAVVSSGNATAALVGNFVMVDSANPDQVLGTAVAQGVGMFYVTDFISATEVWGYLVLHV